MLKSDFHMHTTLSTDGKSDMADMIHSAASMGFQSICFTEHNDYDNPIGETPDFFVVDTDAYYARYCELKNIEPDLDVYFGVELGISQDNHEYFNEYTKKYPFDFIIGSSHYVGNLDPYTKEYYDSFESEEAAHLKYFETELECAKLFDTFDVYGHLDYALRYGPTRDLSFTYDKYADILDELLKTLISKGKGIEINSAGFRKGMIGPNPAESIIKRYKELGGEIITVGSDAHHISELGADFDKAEAVLERCGFKYYTIFKERKPEFISL